MLLWKKSLQINPQWKKLWQIAHICFAPILCPRCCSRLQCPIYFGNKQTKKKELTFKIYLCSYVLNWKNGLIVGLRDSLGMLSSQRQTLGENCENNNNNNNNNSLYLLGAYSILSTVQNASIWKFSIIHGPMYSHSSYLMCSTFSWQTLK